MSPGPVLLRRFVRNKNEPLVDEVELLDCNPSYANIRYLDGKETTVSVRDLAPFPGRDLSPCPENLEVSNTASPIPCTRRNGSY